MKLQTSAYILNRREVGEPNPIYGKVFRVNGGPDPAEAEAVGSNPA